MDLAKWEALTEKQRRVLVVRWCKKLDQKPFELAFKAAGSLEKKLKRISGVTHVEPGSGEVIGRLHDAIAISMPVLRVCNFSA